METVTPVESSSMILPTSNFSSLEKLQRIVEEETRNFEKVHCKRFNRHSLSKGPRPHRDVPIYAPKDSPILEHPYISSTDSDSPSNSRLSVVKTSSIVNETKILDCTHSNSSSRRNSIDSIVSQDSVCWEGMYLRRHSCSRVTDSRRPSDLETLVDNEAAWLTSPLNKWNDGRSECLPYILSQNMPVRRISSTETLPGNDDEDDDGDNILACATALAPSKASVVEVNRKHSSGLSISIPPRTSSLGTTFAESEETKPRDSWQTFGACSSFYDEEPQSDNENDEIYGKFNMVSHPPRLNSKYFLESPERPISPTSLSDDESFFQHERPLTPVASIGMESIGSPSFKNDSLHEIISDLENHLVAFPSRMLVDTSECVAAMRNYLQLPSRNFTIPQQHYEAPLSPALSQDTNFLDVATASGNRHFIPTAHPIQNSSALRLEKPQSSRLGPDLQPLYRIFPETSHFMRSALYAHLLAYIFITSLSPSTPASPHSPFPDSIRPRSRSIPSKAAEFLGMTERERLSTEVNVPSATKMLEDQLVRHISTLVKEMERSFEVDVLADRMAKIPRTVLMSLIEVVRSIESA